MGLFISHSIFFFFFLFMPSYSAIPFRAPHESPAVFCFGLHSINSIIALLFPVYPLHLTRNSPAVNPHQALPFVIRPASRTSPLLVHPIHPVCANPLSQTHGSPTAITLPTCVSPAPYLTWLRHWPLRDCASFFVVIFLLPLPLLVLPLRSSLIQGKVPQNHSTHSRALPKLPTIATTTTTMIRNRPACPLCLHGLGALSAPKFSPPTLSRCMASALLRRRPARFILSNRVTEKPVGGKRKPEPTHGMNRTEANIPRPVWKNRRSWPKIHGRVEGRLSKNEKLDPKHMRMAQSLGVISRAQRDEVKSEVSKWFSFGDFDLLPSIKEGVIKGALGGLDTVEPSPVQKLAIPVLTGQTTRRHKHTIDEKNPYETFLIAAETGSGKTLSYVVPILDYLKRSEEASRKNDRAEASMERVPTPKAPVKDLFDLEIPVVEPKEDKENHGKPRAIVLVPTSELVTQVASVVKSISHIAKFRTAMISSNSTATVIRNRLFSGPLDVLVSTPYLLSSLAEASPKILSKCTHLVADEADSLFDRKFVQLTTSIIERAQALKKLILCSATIPKSLDIRLRESYPSMQRLVSPKIHTVPRRVVLSVVDVDQDPYRGSKPLACADTLSQIAKEPSEEGFVKKVVVFVNHRKSTAELVSFLRDKGFDAANLNRDTDDRRNTAVVEYFTGPKVRAGPTARALEKMKVLVATDIASRGVDTKTVKSVLLYDVPYTTIDFIHRLGRAGRMGKRGKAVLFVDNNTNKAWVKEVKKYYPLVPPSILPPSYGCCSGGRFQS